ncbi:signal peptide peptidase SppA [Rubrivivax gelatinosus]|nr:signal peptide peptidase SppA [Rubrivivax gelatinosus]
MADETKPRSRTMRVLRGLWWLVDTGRRAILNLLLLLVLGAVAWAALRGGPAPLADKTVLVINPQGPIREQFSGSLRENALQKARGSELEQTRLRDLLTALDAGAADPRISSALLVLDDFAGAGLPTLREVAAAVDRFKAGGKKVVAWGSSYDQRQYYLAAHANEVWLHPMGGVEISGMGSQRSYFKGALDQLGVTAHVVRAGRFKNAAETLAADGPSPETGEADRELYDGLWADYTSAVEYARRLPRGSLDRALAELPERLAAAGGDGAKLAAREGLIDAMKTRDELRAALIARGERDGESFRQIGFGAYAARFAPPPAGDTVAVVVAEGPIVDGDAGPGTIGGLSTAALVRDAREDKQVRAVVLRVNSPGGSAFGSELVRRELELTRAAGKPVVVSMGDVAASGGFWISTAADEILADPATITGSIGVIAVLPTAERGLERLGIHTEGYRTGWLAGGYDPRQPLDPRLEQVLQSSIGHVYGQFLARVAAARKTTPERIDEIGQGRVWTGAQARVRGLVDRSGGLRDALAVAAARAKLAPGYRVHYVERSPGSAERLMAWFGGLGASALEPLLQPALQAALPPPLPAPLAELKQQTAWLLQSADGRRPAAMAHCLCAAP